jgi:hypothetical protein
MLLRVDLAYRCSQQIQWGLCLLFLIKEALKEYLAAYPAVISNPKHFVFFNTKTGDFDNLIKKGQAWKFVAVICELYLTTFP